MQNSNSNIKIVEPNIFHVRYNDNAIIDVEDFEETRAAFIEYQGEKELKFLVEFPEFVSITPEARKWAEERQVRAVAEAVVFKGLPQRILLRFYLMFRKQNHLVKTFSEVEKAVDWLRSI